MICFVLEVCSLDCARYASTPIIKHPNMLKIRLYMSTKENLNVISNHFDLMCQNNWKYVIWALLSLLKNNQHLEHMNLS